ncbi:MAG: hypothetical protein DRR16_30010 [Candidatus Parabeggiatoa sp. nov. 3]|nr:MAG: hypothetical protein DRR00_12235 [Gammaproteobacteria bacterium]RKZ66751.1 MAG: hypothetical protein DRQ99_08700 [Gammaproteobacteria bacterium]RKZ77008.1 MAG: hypothetical protein DRR16_30010 [Gammaproteobacteria bacterium]
MKVDIYKAIGSKIEPKRWYVLVKEKTGLDILPNNVLLAAERFSLTKSLEISQGEYRIALDTDEAIAHINKKGFYITGANIAINESL